MLPLLDNDEIYDLVRGRIQWRKCQLCDNNGYEYWDGESGMGVSPTPSGINPDNLAYGPCEECKGLGFYFFRVD